MRYRLPRLQGTVWKSVWNEGRPLPAAMVNWQDSPRDEGRSETENLYVHELSPGSQCRRNSLRVQAPSPPVGAAVASEWRTKAARPWRRCILSRCVRGWCGRVIGEEDDWCANG